jgi:hypothetical protein
MAMQQRSDAAAGGADAVSDGPCAQWLVLPKLVNDSLSNRASECVRFIWNMEGTATLCSDSGLCLGEQRAISLFTPIAGSAGSDEVAFVIGASVANLDAVIDFKGHVGRVLPAVLTGELIALEDFPADGIPSVFGKPLCCVHDSMVHKNNTPVEGVDGERGR